MDTKRIAYVRHTLCQAKLWTVLRAVFTSKHKTKSGSIEIISYHAKFYIQATIYPHNWSKIIVLEAFNMWPLPTCRINYSSVCLVGNPIFNSCGILFFLFLWRTLPFLRLLPNIVEEMTKSFVKRRIDRDSFSTLFLAIKYKPSRFPRCHKCECLRLRSAHVYQIMQNEARDDKWRIMCQKYNFYYVSAIELDITGMLHEAGNLKFRVTRLLFRTGNT
jgi:hypothetical protein